MCTHGEWHLRDWRKLLTSLTPYSELGGPFWPQRPGVFYWEVWAFVSRSYPQTQDSSLVIIVFMKFVSWSAHCRKSLATARQVSFCLSFGSFGMDFAKMCFMPISSVRMDCTKPNKSPNLSESSPTVILQLSSTAERTLTIICWFLFVEGLPEHSSLSTYVCACLNHLNHWTCVQHNASFPKAFWIIS